jgi:hypothetical protein
MIKQFVAWRARKQKGSPLLLTDFEIRARQFTLNRAPLSLTGHFVGLFEVVFASAPLSAFPLGSCGSRSPRAIKLLDATTRSKDSSRGVEKPGRASRDSSDRLETVPRGRSSRIYSSPLVSLASCVCTFCVRRPHSTLCQRYSSSSGCRLWASLVPTCDQ